MPIKDEKIIEIISTKNKIPKSSPYSILSGWNNNRVCIFDEKYVVKLGGFYGENDIFFHQQKLLEQLSSAGAKVPKIIDAGLIEGEKFLLMTKIPGRTLAQLWPKINQEERDNYFIQIGEELKKYHSIKFNEYAIAICQKKPKINLLDAVNTTIDFSKIKKLQSKPAREMFEWVFDYHEKNKSLLDETGTAVLVFNDIRLENVMADGGEISGFVDFDWLCQAAPDYELAKTIYYMYAPQYFSDASLVEQMHAPMKNEINALKETYPEIFDTSNLTNRLRMYFIRNILYLLEKYQNDPVENILARANFIFDAFYKSDKLETFMFNI